MKLQQLFGVGILTVMFTSGHAMLWTTGANAGDENGQAAPPAAESESSAVFPETLPGAVSADIWDVKCLGPVTSLGARACDNGTLDDTFDVSVAGYAPGLLNAGDRGFLRRGSFGGCSSTAFAVRPTGKPGSIKAYVTVSQQGGSGSGYNLEVFCNGTLLNPTAKLVRDQD